MRKLITVIIGFLLVGGSTYGFVHYMKSYELDITMMQTVKPIKMIQAGQLITEDMVQTVSIPTVQHMDNAMLDLKDIIGKRAIVPIGETEEFLSWKIGEDTLYPNENEEYIGFKIDFVGAVNNMVRRGDKVDVWVEYTQPKMYDSNGVEIDQAEQARRVAVNPNLSSAQAAKKVFNKLLIEGLTVAYVKDQDGLEITDSGTQSGPQLSLPGSPSQNDDRNFERYRQDASGQPSYITFIMSAEQYASFAEGAKEGTIRLGLPATLGTIGTIVTSTQPTESKTPKQVTTSATSPSTKKSDIAITPDATLPDIPAEPANNNAAGTETTTETTTNLTTGGSTK